MPTNERELRIALTPPEGSEKCEKHSLPERYEVIESAVKGVGFRKGVKIGKSSPFWM